MSVMDSKAAVKIANTQACGELCVGLARVDITPVIGQPLGGFKYRLDRNEGRCERIHDPLFARVLVMKVGAVSIALVSLDLLFFCSARVIREACDRFGLTQVILLSTHTHSGPIPQIGGMLTWDFLSGNPAEKMDFDAFSQDPWYARTEQLVIDAIGEAVSQTFTARVSIASAPIEEYLAHNRRQVQSDGTVKMLWSNPKRIPTAPLDPTVRVLRIDDTHGKTRAVLTHFACHPVVLGQESVDVSADFPGVLNDAIERSVGSECMSFFIQGAMGDIDPCDMGLHGDDGHEMVRSIGQTLAKHVLQLLPRATVVNPQQTSLTLHHVTHTLPMFEAPERSLELSSAMLTLNQQVSLLLIPGEVFVQHQLDFARSAQVPHAMIAGLACNGHGVPLAMYLPTEQAAREGGYGANSCVVFEPAAGRKLVTTAAKLLQQPAANHVQG